MNGKVLYPLTFSQLSLFLSRKFSMRKSIINVPTSMIIHEVMSMDILEESVKEAIKRWDSFGIRLIKEGSSAKQYFGEREVESILRLDFSNKSREVMEATFKELGSKKLDVYNKPMARIYLVITPEGYGGLFCNISHLIMDSWAISSFYKDVMGIYYAKLGEGEYPKDLVPYEEVLKNEVKYRETSAYERAKLFWEKEFSKEEPIYCHINGSDVLEKYRSKKGKENSRASNGFFLKTAAGHDLYWIEKEDIDQFKEFIKGQQLPSMQTLFQMGLYTYLSKVNREEKDISIYHNLARRGTLQEKRTGGTRAHGLCYRNIMDENVSFIEACHQLLDKQNEIYRHADFSIIDMLNIQRSKTGIKETEGYHGVSMTYQTIPMKLKDNQVIETRWYSNGAVAIMLYINIMDGDGTGGLKCYYEYMLNHITPEKIKEVHESIVKIIRKGCESPDISLKELYQVV